MKRTNRRFKKTKRRKKLQSGGSWGDNFFNNLWEISKQSGDINDDLTVKNKYRTVGIYPYQAKKGRHPSRLLVIKSIGGDRKERWSTPGGKIDPCSPGTVKYQTIFGEMIQKVRHPLDRGDGYEYSVVAAIRECIEETGITPITNNYNLDNIEWNDLEHSCPTFKFRFRILY